MSILSILGVCSPLIIMFIMAIAVDPPYVTCDIKVPCDYELNLRGNRDEEALITHFQNFRDNETYGSKQWHMYNSFADLIFAGWIRDDKKNRLLSIKNKDGCLVFKFKCDCGDTMRHLQRRADEILNEYKKYHYSANDEELFLTEDEAGRVEFFYKSHKTPIMDIDAGCILLADWDFMFERGESICDYLHMALGDNGYKYYIATLKNDKRYSGLVERLQLCSRHKCREVE